MESAPEQPMERGLEPRLAQSSPPLKIWLHGASLGDVNALSGITEALRRRGDILYLSAVTRSGRARWGQLFPDLPLRSPPLLSPWAARRAIRETRVDLLILELLEVWPTWIRIWVNAGVKVVIVDGRISSRTLWAKPLLVKSMNRLTAFLAQTAADAKRAQTLGVPPDRIWVCGDAKLDSLIERRERAQGSHRDRSPLLTPSPLCVLGCLRPRDEAPALSALLTQYEALSGMTIILAPRHLERVRPLIKRAQRLGLKLSRAKSVASLEVSSTDAEAQPLSPDDPPRLFVLDVYGELAGLYDLASVAVIGGTFYDRGQSLLEAALGGCPVIHGPRVSSLRAQRDALSGRGGYEVNSWSEAIPLCVSLSRSNRQEVGASRATIEELRGGLKRQLNCLSLISLPPLLPSEQSETGYDSGNT